MKKFAIAALVLTAALAGCGTVPGSLGTTQQAMQASSAQGALELTVIKGLSDYTTKGPGEGNAFVFRGKQGNRGFELHGTYSKAGPNPKWKPGPSFQEPHFSENLYLQANFEDVSDVAQLNQIVKALRSARVTNAADKAIVEATAGLLDQKRDLVKFKRTGLEGVQPRPLTITSVQQGEIKVAPPVSQFPSVLRTYFYTGKDASGTTTFQVQTWNQSQLTQVARVQINGKTVKDRAAIKQLYANLKFAIIPDSIEDNYILAELSKLRFAADERTQLVDLP
ncbi:hypothetical protein J7643_13175 [bacterium]|nr:hypothetical protein [bacterium]